MPRQTVGKTIATGNIVPQLVNELAQCGLAVVPAMTLSDCTSGIADLTMVAN